MVLETVCKRQTFTCPRFVEKNNNLNGKQESMPSEHLCIHLMDIYKDNGEASFPKIEDVRWKSKIISEYYQKYLEITLQSINEFIGKLENVEVKKEIIRPTQEHLSLMIEKNSKKKIKDSVEKLIKETIVHLTFYRVNEKKEKRSHNIKQRFSVNHFNPSNIDSIRTLNSREYDYFYYIGTIFAIVISFIFLVGIVVIVHQRKRRDLARKERIRAASEKFRHATQLDGKS
ncbi:hypothetical protein SNEBB_007447 [Seison nebaliae]|nr:hypothetical protein SNEBB_007447 [Seison nebaliae]